MRIKRSHLDSLHFVIGTALSCFLVLSVSSNLQAHPLATVFQPKTVKLNADTTSVTETCNLNPTSRETERALPLEPEIREALAPYAQPLTESIETVLNDDCAHAASSALANETEDVENLNALLETVNAAINYEPAVRSCEDVNSLTYAANLPVLMTLASLE